MMLKAHLRNQKLSLRRMSSKYPCKLLFCGDFRDKRLISCFCRCDIFGNMPHSKDTRSNRFSSKYPRKLRCVYDDSVIA